MSTQVVTPGARVKLFCAVDDDYEYCKFISPQQQVCDFEWKRSEGNITMQTCDLDTDNKQVRDSVGCFDVCVKGAVMFSLLSKQAHYIV